MPVGYKGSPPGTIGVLAISTESPTLADRLYCHISGERFLVSSVTRFRADCHVYRAKNLG